MIDRHDTVLATAQVHKFSCDGEIQRREDKLEKRDWDWGSVQEIVTIFPAGEKGSLRMTE